MPIRFHLVHHQGFERRGEGQKTLRNGGLSALPALTYPRNYPKTLFSFASILLEFMILTELYNR